MILGLLVDCMVMLYSFMMDLCAKIPIVAMSNKRLWIPWQPFRVRDCLGVQGLTGKYRGHFDAPLFRGSGPPIGKKCDGKRAFCGKAFGQLLPQSGLSLFCPGQRE